MSEKDLRNRRIKQERYRKDSGFMLQVVMDVYAEVGPYDDGKRAVHQERLKQFGFIKLESVAKRVDVVRGEVPEDDGTPIMFIGNNLAKHYWTSHDVEGCDVDILEWVDDSQYTLYEEVDGGWDHWGGRPEFSDNYVDFSEAEETDPTPIIEERRED